MSVNSVDTSFQRMRSLPSAIPEVDVYSCITHRLRTTSCRRHRPTSGASSAEDKVVQLQFQVTRRKRKGRLYVMPIAVITVSYTYYKIFDIWLLLLYIMMCLPWS